MAIDENAWFPVARADDLVARHVFQGELNGVELALWRDDDGCVNAWENRCMHRSVRLSLGVNTGRRLRCQYHGWQYRSGDGQCVVIPAASQTPPPASVCARTFAVAEHNGLVWANLHQSTGTALRVAEDWLLDAAVSDPAQWPLRSVVLHAGSTAVVDLLHRYADCDPTMDELALTVQRTSRALALTWQDDGAPARLLFLVQPAREDRTIVHALLQTPRVTSATDAALRAWYERHHAAMNRLRQRLVRDGRVGSAPVLGQTFVPAPPREPAARTRTRMIEARVTRRFEAAEDIVAFELQPANAADIGALADFMPGAHIDVATPGAVVRQYSIVSAPGEINDADRPVPGVTLGIKREPDSRGGSLSMHEQIAVDQTLQVSRPKNHFRIANNKGALLIAGGIGVTPMLSMAGYLQDRHRDYALHYFVRSSSHVAFRERLQRLRHHELHTGLAPDATRSAVLALLASVDGRDTDIYVCGPRPLLECVISCAEQAGISTEQVHFELFSNTVSHADDQPFRVRLARSGQEFDVPAGQSLSDLLSKHGCAVETSCEQGVCGTCMVTVLEGEPEHRDVYLSEDEKRSGRCMQACVSRSRSECLVLDL